MMNWNVIFSCFFCFPAQQKSRCEECNINFSKHQNYIAHKKYYCSAVAAGTAATCGSNTGSGGPGGNKSGVGGPSAGQPGLPILSDNDDDKSSDDGKSQSHRKLSPPIASPSALMLGLTSPNRKEGEFYFSTAFLQCIECGTSMTSWVNPYPFIESIHTLNKKVWIDSILRVWIDLRRHWRSTLNKAK